jgi:hypothetical protein
VAPLPSDPLTGGSPRYAAPVGLPHCAHGLAQAFATHRFAGLRTDANGWEPYERPRKFHVTKDRHPSPSGDRPGSAGRAVTRRE